MSQILCLTHFHLINMRRKYYMFNKPRCLGLQSQRVNDFVLFFVCGEQYLHIKKADMTAPKSNLMPLVGACSTAHKLIPLCVSRWDTVHIKYVHIN